jgi:hypothetical protein
MTKILLFTFLLLVRFSISAQNLPAKLDSALLGYWYCEEYNESSILGNKRERPEHIHKLLFTQDSLLMSNFGDQNLRPFDWNCDLTKWTIKHDTLFFTVERTISFSTNLGYYFLGKRDHPIFKSAEKKHYVIKSLSKDSLVIEIHSEFIGNVDDFTSGLYRQTEQKVLKFIKKDFIEMYSRSVSPFSKDAVWSQH